jgi:hypothetical protein
MTYPMPPELLEQLGRDPSGDGDPRWPEDHDALGWGRRVAGSAELEEASGRDQQDSEEEPDGR